MQKLIAASVALLMADGALGGTDIRKFDKDGKPISYKEAVEHLKTLQPVVSKASDQSDDLLAADVVLPKSHPQQLFSAELRAITPDDIQKETLDLVKYMRRSEALARLRKTSKVIDEKWSALMGFPQKIMKRSKLMKKLIVASVATSVALFMADGALGGTDIRKFDKDGKPISYKEAAEHLKTLQPDVSKAIAQKAFDSLHLPKLSEQQEDAGSSTISMVDALIERDEWKFANEAYDKFRLKQEEVDGLMSPMLGMPWGGMPWKDTELRAAWLQNNEEIAKHWFDNMK